MKDEPKLHQFQVYKEPPMPKPSNLPIKSIHVTKAFIEWVKSHIKAREEGNNA